MKSLRHRLFRSALVLVSISRSSLWGDVVTLKDGTQVAGSVEGTPRTVRVKVGGNIQTFSVDQVSSIRFSPLDDEPLAPSSGKIPFTPPAEPAITTSSAPAPSFPQFPVGTVVTVRTIEAIDSKQASKTREYAASLDDPLILNGVEVVPANVNAVLQVKNVKASGALMGKASLSLAIVALTVNGRRVALETGDVVSSSGSQTKQTARNGAVGAAAGCGLGAVFGGALGCGVGGAIGAGGGIITSAINGKSVKVPSETRLSFRLTAPLTIN